MSPKYAHITGTSIPPGVEPKVDQDYTKKGVASLISQGVEETSNLLHFENVLHVLQKISVPLPERILA